MPAQRDARVRQLREAPATLVGLGGAAVLSWFAARAGGYEVDTWAPGGAILLALVVVGVAVVPNAWRALPRSTVVAMALLAASCAWSYASVAWAADPGAAWQASNRTVVYLAAFVLFAAWRQRPATAGVLLGVWTGTITVLASVVTVRLAGTDDVRSPLPGGRLLDPTGYPNATAALLMMACFAAITCAAGRSVPWVLRGLAAGAAVVLADVALLAVSRGSLLASAICLPLLLVVFPTRLRRVAVLLPIAAAVAAAAPRLLDLTDLVGGAEPPAGTDEAHAAALLIVAGALAATVVVGAAGLLEHRRPPTVPTARRLHRAGSVLAAVALLAGGVAAVAVAGNPVTRLDNAWSSFKGGYTEYSGTRLGSGLGSNRYDFYRVAVGVFRDHPVVGAGADNFFEAYLRDGRSTETPRYPHSLELRALSQGGVVGALLLFGAFAAALPAALRAARGREAGDGARVVATAALMGFAYWVVHGSADWFFEYAGLGAAAFALLGLACSLDPARARAPAATHVRWRPGGAVIAVAGLVLVVALLGQWGADRDVQRAATIFSTRSGEAYERLDRARTLDPFSRTPDSVAGSVAVRLGDPARALASFERALERSPDDQYSQLQVGATQSALGRRQAALGSLRRAVELAPRDPLAREALAVVRSGGSIDPVALSVRIRTDSVPTG